MEALLAVGFSNHLRQTLNVSRKCLALQAVLNASAPSIRGMVSNHSNRSNSHLLRICGLPEHLVRSLDHRWYLAARAAAQAQAQEPLMEAQVL